MNRLQALLFFSTFTPFLRIELIGSTKVDRIVYKISTKWYVLNTELSWNKNYWLV